MFLKKITGSHFSCKTFDKKSCIDVKKKIIVFLILFGFCCRIKYSNIVSVLPCPNTFLGGDI